MKWKKDGPPEEGGITWLELFLLYSYHGGNEEELKLSQKDPLRLLPLLQKQFAEFKAAARMVKLYSLRVEDEWILATFYARKHRLLKNVVSNKQASICGMPAISAADAGMIMKKILSMKGLYKKMHA